MSEKKKDTVNDISDAAYKTGRVMRDVKAVQQSAKQKSVAPIVKRLLRKWLGRKLANKLWKILK